jgi:hypothetical protein
MDEKSQKSVSLSLVKSIEGISFVAGSHDEKNHRVDRSGKWNRIREHAAFFLRRMKTT